MIILFASLYVCTSMLITNSLSHHTTTTTTTTTGVGMEWLMPVALKKLNFIAPGDISHDRKGTRRECELLQDISHDKDVVNELLAVSNLDLDLYAYAIQVACVQYYKDVSNMK
jgi:hypothetical protein